MDQQVRNEEALQRMVRRDILQIGIGGGAGFGWNPVPAGGVGVRSVTARSPMRLESLQLHAQAEVFLDLVRVALVTPSDLESIKDSCKDGRLEGANLDMFDDIRHGTMDVPNRVWPLRPMHLRKGDHVLLWFFNPDCACQQVRGHVVGVLEGSQSSKPTFL